jgi:uncharacterized membrane protein YdcZ (DUF606 family)
MGLFGVDQVPFTLTRAVGLILVLGGALLALRR